MPIVIDKSDFNPLPRKEGDLFRQRLQVCIYISIHSLVKRETGQVDYTSPVQHISIHSLVKRETDCERSQPQNRHHFNPLPRKEGDKPQAGLRRLFLYFNPLPRKEGDTGVCHQTNSNSNFNPLPRKEGDDKTFRSRLTVPISIHSLVKRETENETITLHKLDISIHSLVKRETTSAKTFDGTTWDFNPLPRKEGDINVFSYSRRLSDFNPLPCKEGDFRWSTSWDGALRHFNPLPRKEGDTEGYAAGDIRAC